MRLDIKSAARGLRQYIYPSMIILACLLFGGMIGLFLGCSRSSGNLTIAPRPATIVYDVKNREVGRFFAEENRDPIPLNQIPQVVRDATIAVEDARFYTHRGVDLRAIARAVLTDLRGGRYAQGGSTITQQLARSALLTQKKLLTRKIREWFYAFAIERKYSKDQILEFYLNQIYFGHSAYGIQLAARTYFGKDAKELTLSEAALLVGLIRSPGLYDPYLRPEAARGRRGVVLDKMVEYGYLSAAQARAAKEKPLGVVPLKPRVRQAAYFMEYIERQLSGKFTPEELETAGLRIYTTLDMDIQQAAEEMVAGFNERVPGKPGPDGVTQPQLALVALDPTNGYIKAMIGGRDYGNTQYNRADLALRQPGSAIKPFVYTAAIDSREYVPSKIFLDEPKVFGRYAPRNYKNDYKGPLTMQEALQYSSNVIACQITDELGPSRVAGYARKMGLKNLVLAGARNDLNLASLSLGGLTRGVTPMEMAAAYTPLANHGIGVQPIGILKVVDGHGNILLERKPSRKVVLSDATSYVVTNMMRRVVSRGGTGINAYISEYHPVAGKTGTTSDSTNAWFVGFTPNLLAAVWLGNDRQDQPLSFGSSEAARLWGVFMRKATAKLPAASFTPPPGVTGEIAICRASGELFTDRCPPDHLDYAVFLEGTQPTAPCSVHTGGLFGTPGSPITPGEPAAGGSGGLDQPKVDGEMVTVKICRESGALRNAYCPEETIEEKTFRVGEEPTEYCTVHGPWSVKP